MRKLVAGAVLVSSLALAGTPTRPAPDRATTTASANAGRAWFVERYAWALDDLANEAAKRTGISAEFRVLVLEIKASNAAAMSAVAKELAELKVVPRQPEPLPPQEGCFDCDYTIDIVIDGSLDDLRSSLAKLTGPEYERAWMNGVGGLYKGLPRFVRKVGDGASDEKFRAAFRLVKDSFEAAATRIEQASAIPKQSAK